MKIIFYWLSFFFISSTLAYQTLPDFIGKTYQSYGHSRSVYACRMHLHQTVKACSVMDIKDYGCMCTNKEAINTFIQCYAYFQKNTTEAIDFFVNYCEAFGNTTSDIDQITEAYGNYTKTGSYSGIPPVVGTNNTYANLTGTPRKQTEYSQYAYGLEACIEQFLTNWQNSFYYGMAMSSYWGFVLLIGAVSNWSQYLFPGLMSDLTGPVSSWWRRHITLPATFRIIKAQEFTFLLRWLQGYMPSRLESIFLSGFCLVVIIVLSINTYYSVGNEIIFTNYVAQLRYLANRTGINSTILMPFLILFAGRNNILQWLTRWNFGFFMMLHRFMGRIVFLFVVLHAVTFSIALGADYYPLMTLPFMIWGTVSTVAGGIMLFQGTLYLRRRWYETFLVLHILMALLFIIGGWVHINYLGYEWWVFVSIILWGLERIIRVIRILLFGFPEAEIAVMADETLKIEISRPEFWKPIPGGHIFVHFLTPAYFYQSHPFTYTTSVEQENTIVLYIKVKEGVTRHLYNKFVNQPGRHGKLRVAVEGPYGEISAAGKSQTTVFVAGGNGVPGIYAELYDLAKRSTPDSNKILKLYWTIREYRSVHWLYEELNELKKFSNVEVSIFVTRPESNVSIDELRTRIVSGKLPSVEDFDGATTSSCYEKYNYTDNNKPTIKMIPNEMGSPMNPESVKDAIKVQLPHVCFREGRPKIQDIIAEEIEDAPGTIAFATCGHPSMIDETRAEVIKHVGKHKHKRIDFYEQLIGWA